MVVKYILVRQVTGRLDPQVVSEIFSRGRHRVSDAGRPFVITERISLLGNFTSRAHQKNRLWHPCVAYGNGIVKEVIPVVCRV